MKPSEKPIDRVDQFFKNKLEDHTIAPSENAWAKVEEGLSKKNNVVLWRWAAAVLLMGALITIIYQSKKENNQPVLAEKNLPAGKAGIEKGKSIAPTETKKMNAEAITKKVVREDTNHGEKTNHGEDTNHGEAKKVNQRIKDLSKEIPKEKSVAVVEEQNKKLADANISQRIIAEEKVVREDTNHGVVENQKIKVEATPQQKVASSKQKPIKLEF